MNLTYFDAKKIKNSELESRTASLRKYRDHINDVVLEGKDNEPEFSLAQAFDEKMLEEIHQLVKPFKKPKHVILVGIGGSSLGVEAVHSVCANAESAELHVLDTVAAHEIDALMSNLKTVRKASDIAVCVVSKSGKTTETLANTEIILGLLEEKLGKAIYAQAIFISDPKSDLHKVAKKLGAQSIAMAEVVGGRYSVFTPVGLVPLMLLGHDIELFLSGLVDAATDSYEELIAESAARMAYYAQNNFVDYNVFIFDTRLVRLGKWYRQLLAESIGKSHTAKGKKNKTAFLPTVTTPVELHSVGQLYFSAVVPVYTDFISFDDELTDYQIPKKAMVAKSVSGKSLQEISTAMYAGVVTAYQETKLSYRSTVFDENLLYSLGLFMGMRMRETMYLANLLGLNAFDQPNVELYKKNMIEILTSK